MGLFFLWNTQERLALRLVQIWQLSHKSMQNHVISERSHIWSVILQRNSLLGGGFSRQDFHKKACKRLTTYLREYDTVFSK